MQLAQLVGAAYVGFNESSVAASTLRHRAARRATGKQFPFMLSMKQLRKHIQLAAIVAAKYTLNALCKHRRFFLAVHML